MNWQSSAACIGEDIELFFPEDGQTAALAKRICADCPVTQECLESALKVEEGGRHRYGVYGGLSALDRQVRFDGHTKRPSQPKRSCINGHRYVDGSFTIDNHGKRQCLQCIENRKNRERTVCRNGLHTLDATNLTKAGRCRGCALERQRRFKQKQRSVA